MRPLIVSAWACSSVFSAEPVRFIFSLVHEALDFNSAALEAIVAERISERGGLYEIRFDLIQRCCLLNMPFALMNAGFQCKNT